MKIINLFFSFGIIGLCLLANSCHSISVKENYLPWNPKETEVECQWILNSIDHSVQFPIRVQQGKKIQLKTPFNTENLPQNRRFYLYFPPVSTQVNIYLNDQLLNHLETQRPTTIIELTEFLTESENLLTIDYQEQNNLDEIRIDSPIIFHSNEICLSKLVNGATGILATSSHISPEWSNLQVQTFIDNPTESLQYLLLKAELFDPYSRCVLIEQQVVRLKPGLRQSAKLNLGTLLQPMLWSPETPNLYQLRVQIQDEMHQVIDSAKIDYGFRWGTASPSTGFFTNGLTTSLRGISRSANQLTDPLNDILKAKEIGANLIVLEDGPQNDYILSLCDYYGLWVCEQLKDPFEKLQISQHKHHPSLLFWHADSAKSLNELKPNNPMHFFVTTMSEKKDNSKLKSDLLEIPFSAISKDQQTYQQVCQSNEQYGIVKIVAPQKESLDFIEYSFSLLPAQCAYFVQLKEWSEDTQQLLKLLWTKKPVLHICHSISEKETQWEIRLLSNLREIKMSVNGNEVSSTNPLLWKVDLQNGENLIVVTGKEVDGSCHYDEFKFTLPEK